MDVRDLYNFVMIMFLAKFSQSTDRQCHNETERCFWMGTGSKTWDAARTACQSEGGDLAVMEVEELYDFITNLFTASATWIGLSDIAQESDFRWLNGDPLRYQRFRSNEPNNQMVHNCVGVYPDGTWDDSDCVISYAYLCSTSAPNCSVVRDGCTEFKLAFMGRVTGPYPSAHWSTAKANCETRGQRLMTIDSQEEEDYVMNTLNLSSSIYLGLRDTALETVFRTDEGFTAPWAKWGSTEPNDPASSAVEHCVKRNIDSHWFDVPCHISYIYYCEGPKIYMNGVEEESETLIDNDVDTCVNLTGSDGCKMDRMSVRSAWANREITMEIKTSNVPCSDLSVVWRITWQDVNYGKYMKCNNVSMSTMVGNKYTCSTTCDVKTTGTTELKITSKTLTSSNPAICDIKIL